MGPGETERQMAERHVALGRVHIVRQLEIIHALQCQGYPTGGAERLLANYEELQRMHEAHLARLQNSN
jgi:hypothetical protein